MHRFTIYTFVFIIIIILESCQRLVCKCFIEKDSLNCFGSTWKQDLFPIDNDSLQKLNISKCSKPNEYSSTLDIGFIKNLSKLRLLSITECELNRPPNVHDTIHSIEILNLSHNQIDEKSQYDALGMNFFKRLPNLKILDLSYNRLKDLPKIWFDCPNKLEILNLNGNLISGLDPTLVACFPHLKELYLRNNKFTILKKPNDFKPIQKDFIRDSIGLSFSESSKRVLPPTPTNLRHKVAKGAINQKSYSNIIPQFPSLEILDLAFNKIRLLDQIPLLDLQNLLKLNLRGNRLSTSPDIVGVDNKCNFGTAPFYIKSKFGLQHLDLSDNIGLSRIHSCWTFGLQNLRILEVSNCSLNVICESAFDKMKNLNRLDLSHNQFNEVPKELTVVSNTLFDLNFAFNNISQLTSSSLMRMENLRTLNLSHNQFQNFLTYSPTDSDSKAQESLLNFQPPNDSPELDEPVSFLGKMRHLRDLDFSFNNLLKISATTDLPPSIKSNGEMWRINLNGNFLLSQLIDFNYEEITPTLSRFSLSNQSRLDCNCHLIGFVKWILHRRIELTVKCSSPSYLENHQITSKFVLDSIMANKECGETTPMKITKPIYKLKLASNANRTTDSLLDNGPMNSNLKKQTSNNKRLNDHQKWAMIGSNLILRCEFYSSHQRYFAPTIEWQRIKMLAIENNDQNQQSFYQFLKTENSEQFDSSKYQEKLELLNSHYDLRIKTFQIGPLDEKIDISKLGFSWNTDIGKNITTKFNGKPYRYVSYLSLQPIYQSDIGRYRCLVNELPVNEFYGQSQLASKEEEVKVFTPPRFTATPSNPMSIIEGETAEITCRAAGYPPPTTSLGKIGSKDFPAARGRRMVMYKEDSSFYITRVRQYDAGNYSCTSRNAAGTISHNFTLKVQIPATFVEKAPDKITVIVGQPLIIKFKINGVPSPKIRWLKDGQDIVANDRISFSADQLMFVVQSTTLEDAGSYRISILNGLGGSDASLSVRVVDDHGISHNGMTQNNNNKPSIPTPPNSGSGTLKEPNWMSDYWLSAIIIIVVLSILLTSILWITIFLCFGKLIGSKKRRLLLISNSQSKSSFDKCLTATTNFSNPRNHTPNICHIPLSNTTSTIVRHDQSREECHDLADSDIASESVKTCSEFYSPQISRSGFPDIQSTYSISNHMFHSQPYLTTSKIDISNCLNQSSSRMHHKLLLKNEPCDSGIDSSHIYSETLNSSDISSIYKCRHKSKHKTNNPKRKRHQNLINSNESSEAMMPGLGVLKTLSISSVDTEKNAQIAACKDYLLKQSKCKKLCNSTDNSSTPLVDSGIKLQFG